ncbi:MAG: hypothetical protein Ct9H300mP18_11570 [Candidatus Neomarinimicrobiota bacterium]|nr:MAG: hypothetical protein Ct9H300mP18_11570 [Candidatus Neomarinimicrobiota bacterium]
MNTFTVKKKILYKIGYRNATILSKSIEIVNKTPYGRYLSYQESL